ncbi:uncharacterized protein LY89DRAFT_691873 [Mollisia scopiformis]|uniref:Uncharacterized protein n=1 Tax=Mollisia scopiformis TaxID=149040 RepID=A0A132B520_MOLSC|nr:uncharacterized protein LY89DRAFT_691873 [Mollisia scopiformis]KUJ07431.1 hypothetical protein LY89DRAFT_691873 [Mollisia scopiformis]
MSHSLDHTEAVADPLFLKPGMVLYHGSMADQFAHQEAGGPSPTHYVHPPTPDGPAWFANNEKFSLHAAVRFTKPQEKATITLHTYTVKSEINMFSMPNMAAFKHLLKEQFKITANFNGIMEGLALAKNSLESLLEGYALMEDTVRGEPEYVLFESGMKRLYNHKTQTVLVIPINAKQSNLVDEKTQKHIAVYTYFPPPGKLE